MKDLPHYDHLLSPRQAQRRLKSVLKLSFGGACAYCGEYSNKLTLDHFIPRQHGGKSYPTNLLPCCITCNGKKGSAMPYQWFAEQPFYSNFKWGQILLSVGYQERVKALLHPVQNVQYNSYCFRRTIY